MHVCMMHDPWSWYMHVWCIYQCSPILDSDACVYDAHIYDPGPWSWSMHVCVVHVSMMRQILSRTDEQGDSRSRIRSLTLMYVWCIYSWSWYTWPWYTYIWCMISAFIHDPDTACIFGLRSLTLIHVCVMHTSIIRDPDTCVYDACIHDAAYLSCMYKPWLWCIYTLCMYVLCIYICDPWCLTMLHVSMMRQILFRKDERTRRF